MISQVFAFVAFLGIAAAHLLPVVHEPVHHAPQPYKFGYDIKDKHGNQYREEQGNGAGGVKGSYGFTDDRGVKRQVDYVADHAGFRAQVKTNEPGTANQNPAAVQMISDAPYQGGVALNGYGGYGLGGAGLGYGVGAAGLGYGLGGEGLGYGLGGEGLGYGLSGEGLGYGLGGEGLGYGLGGVGLGYGLGGAGLGYGGLGGAGLGYGGLGGAGLGYGGLGYRGAGLGGYGLGGGLLGGLGYTRYGY